MGRKRFRVCRNFYWTDLSSTPLKFIKGILTHRVHGRDVICMQTLYANGTNCSYIEFVPDFSSRGFANVKVARFPRKDERRLRSSKLTFFNMSLMQREDLLFLPQGSPCLSRISCPLLSSANKIEFESITRAQVTQSPK